MCGGEGGCGGEEGVSADTLHKPHSENRSPAPSSEER